jgi:Flp pilus assembly protein CpaB
MPGDHVDVLLTHEVAPPADANGAQPLQMTETLLVHIKVLATDQRTDDVNGQVIVSKTATLEVSSKEAEMLALAQQVGQLSLALNSAVEPASFDPRRAFEVRRAHIASYTGTAELTFVSAPPPVPATKQQEEAPVKAATTHVVVVVRGSQQQEMTFDGDKATPVEAVPQQSTVPDAGQGRSASMAVKLESTP